jgi:hypothetical protein
LKLSDKIQMAIRDEGSEWWSMERRDTALSWMVNNIRNPSVLVIFVKEMYPWNEYRNIFGGATHLSASMGTRLKEASSKGVMCRHEHLRVVSALAHQVNRASRTGQKCEADEWKGTFSSWDAIGVGPNPLKAVLSCPSSIGIKPYEC